MSKKAGEKMFTFLNCMNDKSDVNSILYSRCLLYLVLFVSLLNLFYLLNINDTNAVLVFLLIGFITSFFIKNMIVIIFFSMLVAYLYQTASSNGEFFEGMKNGDEEEEGMKNGDGEEEEGMKNGDEEEEGMKNEDEDEYEGMKNEYDDEEEGMKNEDEDEYEGMKNEYDEEEEGMENGDEKEEEGMENGDDKEEEGMENGDDKEERENFKFQYQGQKPDRTGNGEYENKYEQYNNKTEAFKEDMKEYMTLQDQLLDILKQSEPLLGQADKLKEKYSKKM